MSSRSVADRLVPLGRPAGLLALVLFAASPLIAAVPPRGAAPRRTAPAARASTRDPVVARVQGEAIRLGEIELLRDRNLERYKEQTGREAPQEFGSFFLRAGLEEAVRRRLLELDAVARGMKVTDAQAESLMRQDPFFRTNSGFDAARFAAYKAANPQGFAQARDEARSILLSQRRLTQLQRQFLPTPAEVDARAGAKTMQARLRYTLISGLHYDPENDPTDDELRAYYEKEKSRLAAPAELRYSTALVPGDDHALTARAADSLLARVKGGAPFDSILRAPGIQPGSEVWRPGVDTGAFGQRAALAESLLAAKPGDVLPRVLDVPTGSVVLRIDSARPSTIPPLSRVAVDLRARWRAEKVEAAQQAAIKQFYDAHPDSFVVPGWYVRWGVVDSTRVRPAPPREDELKAWYAKHATEFARLDPSGAGIQLRTLDEVRPLAVARWIEEQRDQRTRQLADDAATAWARGGSGPKDPALAAGGPAWLVAEGAIPAGLPAALADSVRSWTVAPRGLVVPDPVGFAVVALLRYETHSHASLDVVSPRIREILANRKLDQERVQARAWFESHADRFKTGPGYVVLSVTTPFPSPAQVDVPAADLQRYYREHEDEFGTPTEVHVRHVLIGLGRHKDLEARSIAAQVLSRARRGEDFQRLARTFSEDPGSKDQGGDLGFIRRGQTVPPFEQAAFALSKEQPLSSVVKTRFGYHVIQFVERREGTTKPFDEVQTEIGRKLAIAYADTIARKQADALRREAKDAAGLARLAEQRNLASQLGTWFEGQPLTGIAVLDDVRRDVATTAPGELLPGVYRNLTQGYAVVGLDSTLTPRAQTFDQVEAQALEEWRREGREEVARQRADRLAQDLAAGVPWDKALETVGGEVPSGAIRRGQGLPTLGQVPGLDSLVFGPGPDTLKTGGWARLETPRGTLFVHLDERIPAPGDELARARDTIANALLNRRIYDYVEELRKKYPVTVLRSDLSERIPPPPLD